MKPRNSWLRPYRASQLMRLIFYLGQLTSDDQSYLVRFRKLLEQDFTLCDI